MATETVKEKPLHKQLETVLKQGGGAPVQIGGALIHQRGNTVVIDAVEKRPDAEQRETATDGSQLP